MCVMAIDNTQIIQLVAIVIFVAFLLVWSIPAVDRWIKKRKRIDQLVVDIEQLWKTRDILQTQLHWSSSSDGLSHRSTTEQRALIGERRHLDQQITHLQKVLDELEGTTPPQPPPQHQPQYKRAEIDLMPTATITTTTTTTEVATATPPPALPKKRAPKAE